MEVDPDEPKTSPSTSRSPTQHIRDRNRQVAQQHREEQRAKTIDTVRFGLGEVQEEVEELDELTEQDINGLITRITRRKHASAEEMHKLSEAFLKSMDNIKLFFEAPGALQVIVKEIIGLDSGCQVGALECLCNLSLGEEPVCEKIIHQGGRNLVQCLDSPDERLKRTSLWIIANTISTSPKAAQTIVQMNIVPKLFYIYLDDSGEKNIANEFREDAAVCLQILVMGKNRAARQEDITFIKDNMIKKCRNSVAAEYHLKIIFHADIVNPRNEFNIEQTHHLMDFILGNLYSTPDFGSIANRLRIVYAIRVLSNMVQCVPTTTIDAMRQQLRGVWETHLDVLLNKVFDFGEDLLSLEVVYLIRNLIHDKSPQPLPCPLDRLQVPNIDYEKLLPQEWK
ncbi:uncharacterized protein LOC126752264 [Bactrocera neohumeralis]|uniref:uncharacterized protein LOC120767991 n=1 Tax=Bactrocera tryoni TaxID=59916 RepID=UPI001A9683B4|nr:uncharacterized protein LOC120767991 [Bactrocera tryoni]XP_050318917.1 uncharacterized protein LOC126752264 [Bactrocera neohumeralis]